MTKPSKIGFSVIGALLVVVLAGFAGGKMAGGDGGGGAGGTDVSQATWIAKIQKAHQLRVGCADSPPTINVKSDGTCTGPDLIPMQDLADELGVKMVTVATTWQSIVAGLQADRYDVAADLDQTVERGLSIQFTNSSWSYPGVFVLPKDTKLTTANKVLKTGEPIATAQGTALDAALQAIKAKELRVDTYQNAMSAVQAGRAVALFADLGTAVDMATKQKGYGIVVPNPAIFVHYVAYGVPTGIDPRSLQIVNIAIDNAVASGSIARAFAAAGYKDVDQLGALEIKP